MRNSFNEWQRYQIKQGAKPRNKSGGAKRRNWAHQGKHATKSVCFVRTRDDDNRNGR